MKFRAGEHDHSYHIVHIAEAKGSADDEFDLVVSRLGASIRQLEPCGGNDGREQLQFLTKANPTLYRAYLLKENLRLALKAGPDEIAGALTKWLAWAQRCRIPTFRELRRKINEGSSRISPAFSPAQSRPLQGVPACA